MPAFTGTAPGKMILFGEHAVVYGRPAIAAPVGQVRAKAVVTAMPHGAPGHVRLIARDIGLDSEISSLAHDDPLALAVDATASRLGIHSLPALHLEIKSTIPIAAGLGSGAAVTAAIARALSGFLGHPLADEDVSTIAFQVDQRHHGTPSGIDNTVVSYAQPIWYLSGQPFERLRVSHDFNFVIGHTGVSSPTGVVVGEVRQAWLASPGPYERIFDDIAAVTRQARLCMEQGPPAGLGPLMNRNQALLQELGVSSPELDRLVEVARQAGARGAKLCGAGRGGNMIALVDPESAVAVAAALQGSGAIHTIITTIHKSGNEP